MVAMGIMWRSAAVIVTGVVMRRVILVALVSAGLSGCASFSMDALRPTPPPVTVQLESVPPGADAVTSVGPGCKTPCSVSIPSPTSFTVSYSLNKYQPATVPVQVTQVPGDFTTPATTSIDPNPVVAELQPAAPPKRAKRVVRKRRPVAAVSAPAAAAPAAASPFPAPAR